MQGEALQLGFRDDDVDDAPKSLTVLDRAGGQVVCIDYQIPAAPAGRQRARVGAGGGLLIRRAVTDGACAPELAGRSAPVEGGPACSTRRSAGG